MEHALSPSSPIVTDRQARKLVAQLTPGMVEAIVSSKLPRDRFQQLITQEKALRMRSRFVQFLRDLSNEIADTVLVHCNYDEPNIVETVFAANHFDFITVGGDFHCYRYSDLPFRLPLVGKGEVDHEVMEMQPDHYRTVRDMVVKIDQCGYKHADPLTALLYALMLPERQAEYPLAVFFDNNGEVWEMMLHGLGGKVRTLWDLGSRILERKVHFSRCCPEGIIRNQEIRHLVVQK